MCISGPVRYSPQWRARAINANSYLQLDVIGIADSGAGKAATGAVTVSGTATSSGTLSVWVAGEQVTVDVETGDEPSKIIPALVEAMTQTPSLLVTGNTNRKPLS